ncbi:hypothetical protein Taro_011942 [Colocasia esculenta]|uniref:RRM domain-containing protein n=1 Tax=Colocasia esculenta TaxID=4460 RepID=A0A843UC93_COLES|nr:hypothetical protein [Colocasia esculenta]
MFCFSVLLSLSLLALLCVRVFSCWSIHSISAMPPRSARKASGGSSGPGKRTAARAKAVEQQVVESAEKATGEVSVVEVVMVEEVVKVEELETEKTPAERERETEANGSVEEDAKEVYAEEENGARLDLEDIEPEYDPEEEAGMGYDEKETEDEYEQVESDHGEEEGDDGYAGEDYEHDMIEEIISDGGDSEGEEDDEQSEEEHEDIVEKEEQHEVVAERQKRKEFEVFVGGLDKESTEEDLKKVFSEVGEVVEVRLMKNPQTKKNKGFAFLRFATVGQAKRAVAELKNPVVNGKQCGVSPSQDNDTLFLGNICRTWTKEHLKEKLKQYGVENIEDLTLVEDCNNEGNNRGFAFLEFASRTDAMDAYRRLQKKDVVFGVDRNAKVSFADSFIGPDDEIMAQVKTVFVDGLPASWDEERVREYLWKYGQIEKVELARNMAAAKRKDFGFVTFDTHDSAVKCAEAINNVELGQGDKKVKVRARLSRPRRRGRGKHGLLGDLRILRGPRGGHLSWSHPVARRFPSHSIRSVERHGALTGGRGLRRPIGFGDKRSISVAAERDRHAHPLEWSYDRRAQTNPYPKSTSKRDYMRHKLPSRSSTAAEYDSRIPVWRRSYRDEYTSHQPGYTSSGPRSAPRLAARKSYADEGYLRRIERSATYRESHGHDYDSISGSKRSYATIDEVPPRYADVGMRQTRPRLEYGVTGNNVQYDDYGERFGRSRLGYGSSRSSLSSQDPHSIYSSSRQGSMSSDIGGMYSSYSSGNYLSRSDV